MKESPKTTLVLQLLIAVFILLALAFSRDLWGAPDPVASIPLVDVKFLDTATARVSFAEQKKVPGADLSDFDCYGCHEKNKPPPLRFDANQKIIIPKEHETITMGHGNHNRNNNCYNCHDEKNLDGLAARDGRFIPLDSSTPLCGSCHGPTLRDWEAGVHGRTSGLWTHEAGKFKRQDCVACHNPHSPKFPGRQPAPPPHTLRGFAATPAAASSSSHH